MKYYVDKKELEELINKGCNDNANISYSPEVIAKYTYDKIAKQYALDIMPKEVAEAHNEGILHVHDMEYYALRPNCFNFDLRFFIRNGLSIDGKGVEGSVANPARSLEVLLNHLLQALMAGAQVFSGGLGIANFNTFLAPLCKSRSYYDIKQTTQGLIFNCNMSLVAKGSQCLFSSVGLDMSVPDHLKDVPAVTFEGETIGTYKDYQHEADMIFKAFLEVLNEKDASGQWHRFPNTLINIQDGDLDEYKGTCKVLHELGANNPTLYYTNQSNYVKSIMGCVDGSEGIWCKINDEVMYKTFFELSELLNADYGATPVDNIEVLTIDDDKNIVWNEVKYFIKNKNQQMYKVTLLGNKSFICDENHDMITFKGLNKKPVLECTNGTNLIDVSCKDINVDFNVDYKSAIMGFWLGDGVKTVDYGNIIVSKEDKKEYLKYLFKKSDIEYDLIHKVRPIDDRHINPNIYDFKFNISDLNDLDINNFDLDDINVCAGLLSGLLSSDGYIRKTGKYKASLGAEFVSTDFGISRLFKYCCFMTGLKFSSTIKDKQKEDHNDFERIYISCNESTIHTMKQLCLRMQQKIIVGEFDEDMFRQIKPYKGQRIKNIEMLDKRDSFCLEVNDRMIIGSDFILTGQCRTALPMNFTGVYDLDCLNTGNFAYTTLNLPLLALEADGNVDKFYELLDKYCDIARKGLLNRRELVKDVIYNKHMSDFLLQRDKVTGIPLYDIDRTTITLGFCGLYECMKILNYNFGENIIQFINKKTEQYKKEDGLRWSVIASPCESASHRFAMIIKDKYPEVEVQGTEGNYYLTNSSHIPVDKESDIITHIRNADKYHPLTKGGNILHIWFGESYHDPVAIWKLNKRILATNTNFWAFTNDFTYCNSCHNTFNMALESCNICNSNDLTVFSRITGYYVPVQNWNNGKREEFNDRYRHNMI